MKELTLAICVSILVFLFVLAIKNEVTFRQQMRINDAIYNYHVDCINRECYSEVKVDWLDIESYDKTLFRLWDWSYKRILPPDKFEIIKPYIK